MWNYRLIAKDYQGDVWFDVHEVYYTNGVPDGYTANPVTVGGDSIAGVVLQLKMIQEDIVQPPLWGGYRFPEEYVAEHKK